MLDWTDLAAIDSLMREVTVAEILPRFGTLSSSEIHAKTAADDLVTVADVRAEAALTRGLQALFPDAAVIGEETVTAGFDFAEPELLFVIDPVDGTWNFARGLPVFGCMIAVMSKGRTVAGLIHYPMQGDTLAVREGDGVRRLTPGASTRLPMLKADAEQVLLLPLSLYDAPVRGQFMSAFHDAVRIVTVQCSAYEYRLLAEGTADLCLSTGLKPWDHAAGQLMLAELGGFAATADGRQWPDVVSSDILISARSPAMWGETVARLS